ncbi:hypothetical protein [Flavobacterium sp.]|uniref:hypothetical protein n=1 Tax=Flavobacterium sp. TaxID=239 RepID=UPI00286DF532|nr:hypothetical protein [Flavobacterium sp.]
MAKIGVYITGLGETFHQESVEKYATRFRNELSYNSIGAIFEIKTEKIDYQEGKQSTVVSIIEKKDTKENVIYKFYDFKYREILIEKFNKYNILYKNVLLFVLVVKKFPILLKRLFFYNGYNRTGQTFYIFLIFLIISLAILFMIPSAIIAFMALTTKLTEIQLPFKIANIDLTYFSVMFVMPLTTLLLLIIPRSKEIVTSLATEFACVDSYIQYGDQSQLILGNLDLLIEYISETNIDSKIHIHSYSLGSILALDLLYPIGNVPSINTKKSIELFITIGTPYEFIKAYYTNFYTNRCLEMDEKLKWINVYSISDALATNFKKDGTIGESEFGIEGSSLKPININYEISPIQDFSLINFITLYHLKIHQYYWDASTNGQSCMRMVFNKMKEEELF